MTAKMAIENLQGINSALAMSLSSVSAVSNALRLRIAALEPD